MKKFDQKGRSSLELEGHSFDRKKELLTISFTGTLVRLHRLRSSSSPSNLFFISSLERFLVMFFFLPYSHRVLKKFDSSSHTLLSPLYHWSAAVVSGENSNERFIPVECFRKKRLYLSRCSVFLSFTGVRFHLAENSHRFSLSNESTLGYLFFPDFSEAPFLWRKVVPRKKGHPPTRATLGEPNFPSFSYKIDEPFTCETKS